MQRWTWALGLGMAGVIAAGGALAEETVEAQPVRTAQVEDAAPMEEGAPASDASAAQSEEPGTALDALGGFSLTGEFLFLQPTLDDTFFVVKAPPSPLFSGGERLANDVGYQPAFRLGLAYEFPDTRRRLALDYTRLDASETQSVAGNNLSATVGRADFAGAFENYPGTASSDLDVNYERIDARFTQPWSVSGIDFGFHFGLEYAYIQTGEEFRFTSHVSDVDPTVVSSAPSTIARAPGASDPRWASASTTRSCRT